MANRGKNIHLFLIDGEPRGKIKCTLANWTGVAYKIPRTELDRCGERPHFYQSGVYFLFGTNDETGETVVYIGQASARKNGEGVLNRLVEHRRNTDYWTEAVILTTTDNSFGPTEISYLEHRFYNLAKEAERYGIKNCNDPTLGNITEEKECELEEFIDYAKVVMGALGYKLFEPLTQSSASLPPEPPISPDKTSELFLSRNIKGVGVIEAMGSQTSEGFVVLKGSHISPVDDATISTPIRDRRKNAPLSEDGTLTENLLFSSPSSAAMFVIGKSANGLTSWKDKNKTTLKKLEARKATNQTSANQPTKTPSSPDKPPELFLSRNIKGVGVIEAMGSQTSEGFVVHKGSHISPIDDATISTPIRNLRKNAPLSKDGTLTEDLLFSSPSSAAMFVIGKSANG